MLCRFVCSLHCRARLRREMDHCSRWCFCHHWATAWPITFQVASTKIVGKFFQLHSSVGQAASLPAITSSQMSLNLVKRQTGYAKPLTTKKRMFYHRRTMADCTVWHESIWIKTSKWMKTISFDAWFCEHLSQHQIFTEVITCSHRNRLWRGFQGKSCRGPVSCAWKGDE